MTDAQNPGVLPTPLGRTTGHLPANGGELADSGHRGEEALPDHPVAPLRAAATESEALPVKATLDEGTAASSTNSTSTPEMIHPRKQSIFGRLNGPARVLLPVEQSGSPSGLVLFGRPEMDREINVDESMKSKNDTHLATDLHRSRIRRAQCRNIEGLYRSGAYTRSVEIVLTKQLGVRALANMAHRSRKVLHSIPFRNSRDLSALLVEMPSLRRILIEKTAELRFTRSFLRRRPWTREMPLRLNLRVQLRIRQQPAIQWPPYHSPAAKSEQTKRMNL
jgi:hypothetical protein